MQPRSYFVRRIPLALFYEYAKACLFFNTTIKDHLIASMQSLIIRYHKELEESKPDAMYEHNTEVTR